MKLTYCEYAALQHLKRRDITRDECRFNDVGTMNRLTRKGYAVDHGTYWSIK